MASEGSREIDAAKQRLAAAKTLSTTASKIMDSAKAMMEAAKKNMENAESLIQSSSKEVKDAEKFLEEAEKRWDVIDIDQESDSPEKKRRKLSLSPQESSDNANGAFTSGTATSSSNLANGNRAIEIDQVVVEGSGMEAVNGYFERAVGKLRNDAPIYSKKGKYKGKTVDFVMFRCMGDWFICTWRGDVRSDNSCPVYSLYSCISAHSVTPPENGWTVLHRGVKPAPQCQGYRIGDESSIVFTCQGGGGFERE